ncbi:MAG TPA: hypothetical protein VFD58_08300 [Blastocatellia bacterium]|nr:hypothetical protein [Blastocatellia bacterium]
MAEDDYWQAEQHLGLIELPPFNQEQDLFFLWHRSEEKYPKNHREIGVRLPTAGVRDYVHVKACYYTPNIILTVGLTEPVQTSFGEEIGSVEGVRREGSTRHFIGSLQAWYYRGERTLMLWEVDLFGPHSADDPTEDFLLQVLWHYFEQGLLVRFPDCLKVVTPGWEPKYEGASWREFLKGRGFFPYADNTFIKPVGEMAIS